MEKWMCLSGLVISGLLFLAFLLDLIIGFPFGGTSVFLTVDILGLIAAVLLAYLSYNAYRDIRV